MPEYWRVVRDPRTGGQRLKLVESDACSVCHAADFRSCLCPWRLPFGEWPEYKLRLLEDAIQFVPTDRPLKDHADPRPRLDEWGGS